MYPDKSSVKHAFSTASGHYDGAARLQRTVGTALLQSVDVANQGGLLLDIGCGTGFLTGELLALSGCGHIIALDMALGMLHSSQQKLAGHANVGYLCADAEALPLADGCVDGVFSNLALQWCGDLKTVFTGIRRVLKPGGNFVFATFGPATLQELKAAWATVDDYPHVNDFYGEQTIASQLRQTGFAHVHSQCQHYRPRYVSVHALMQELKHIGAHNSLPGRNKRVTGKAALQRMMAAYPQDPRDGSIRATFEVIMIAARR